MTYEMTKPTMTKPARLMLTLCAAALLGVAPFHLSLDPSTGLIGVSSAMAQASGSDDNGSDSSNDGDSSGSDSDSNGVWRSRTAARAHRKRESCAGLCLC